MTIVQPEANKHARISLQSSTSPSEEVVGDYEAGDFVVPGDRGSREACNVLGTEFGSAPISGGRRFPAPADRLPNQVKSLAAYGFSFAFPIESKLCEGVAVRNNEPSDSFGCGGDRADMSWETSIARIREQVDLSGATSGDNDAIPIEEKHSGHG